MGKLDALLRQDDGQIRSPSGAMKRIVVRCPRMTVVRLDALRSTLGRKPSRAAMIRTLVEVALKAVEEKVDQDAPRTVEPA